MLKLVTGGAASGKSAFAEKLIVESGITCRAYVACMQVRDAEDMLRVARHRQLRENKGFETFEAPLRLDALALPENAAVLIEDIVNLAANECFATEEGFDGAYERIMRSVEHVANNSALTVAVTCELGADGARYDEFTKEYISLIARLNAGIAKASDEAYEIVVGLPLCLKGGTRR